MSDIFKFGVLSAGGHDRQVVLVQRHCHQQHQLSGLLGYASLLFLPGLPILSRLSLDVFGSELLALPCVCCKSSAKEQEARAGTAELVDGTSSGTVESSSRPGSVGDVTAELVDGTGSGSSCCIGRHGGRRQILSCYVVTVNSCEEIVFTLQRGYHFCR